MSATLKGVLAANGTQCLEEPSRRIASARRTRDSQVHEHEALP